MKNRGGHSNLKQGLSGVLAESQEYDALYLLHMALVTSHGHKRTFEQCRSKVGPSAISFMPFFHCDLNVCLPQSPYVEV